MKKLLWCCFLWASVAMGAEPDTVRVAPPPDRDGYRIITQLLGSRGLPIEADGRITALRPKDEFESSEQYRAFALREQDRYDSLASRVNIALIVTDIRVSFLKYLPDENAAELSVQFCRRLPWVPKRRFECLSPSDNLLLWLSNTDASPPSRCGQANSWLIVRHCCAPDEAQALKEACGAQAVQATVSIRLQGMACPLEREKWDTSLAEAVTSGNIRRTTPYVSLQMTLENAVVNFADKTIQAAP